MADVFTTQKRSEVMSRIRSQGTGIEECLFAMVREALGPRWRIDRNRADLPGQPDVVVPNLRTVFFADGCFFHLCPRHGRIPDSNRDYWEPKLRRNARRDRRVRRQLRMAGFSVWRVWEHDLKGVESRLRTQRRIRLIVQRRIADVRG